MPDEDDEMMIDANAKISSHLYICILDSLIGRASFECFEKT